MRGNENKNVIVMEQYSRKEDNKDKMIKRLSKYINAIMSDYFPTYVKKYGEDLYQEGVLAILESIKDYDITKGAPTTFFHIRIRHAMYEYIASQVHGISAYYLKEISDLDKVLKYHECSFEEISEEQIMKELHYTKEKYEKISRMYKIVQEEFNIPSDYFDNIPASEEVEDVIVKKEKIKEIAKVINNLDDDEKYIVKSRLGLTEKKKNLPEICCHTNLSLYKVKLKYFNSLSKIKKEYLQLQ